MAVVSEGQAMTRALRLAWRGPSGPNPRVGCVVLDHGGLIIGEGWHEGTGTPHSEVIALAAAGPATRGSTVIVTLEPCAHQGRTGPCVEALVQAGVRRVVYGCRDPNPIAAGGAAGLSAAGVDVVEITDPALRQEAAALVERWVFALQHARPFVTWKLATTLDGRSAARDGSSRWITGAAARADVHRLRAECDTVLVGTGTVEVDDPQLTVRDPTGRVSGRQPMRAVMGVREISRNARVLDAQASTMQLRTRDPGVALADLWRVGSRHVLLEGGPTLAAAFVRADYVDEIVAYVAPALVGAGAAAIADLGTESIAEAHRFELVDAVAIGGDARLTLRSAVPPTGSDLPGAIDA